MRFQYWSRCLIGFAIGFGPAGFAFANEEAVSQCPVAEVTDHVREQFARFGPQSASHEYFGFVYRLNGRIESAVIRSSRCTSADRCTTNTAGAARAIPGGARVLGEWHTHPTTTGSRTLSAEDVRGAFRNRRIRCYTAFYSTPNGDIYRWDTNQTSVPTAMNTRKYVGNHHDAPALMVPALRPGERPLAELPEEP